MKLVFDSIDEVRAFIEDYDGEGGTDTAVNTGAGTTRRRRRTKAEMEAEKQAQSNAGQNAQPGFAPPNAAPQTGFAPPSGAPAQQGFGAPPNFAQQQPPQVHPLVAAIIAKAEAAVTQGQKLEDVTNWFRGSLGPEAAQLTWEQIKVIALPKASEPTLTNIAKLLNVTS